MTLVSVPEPEQPEGIDLRCCSVHDLLHNMPGAPTLVIADPPWSYTNDRSELNGIAGNHYATTSDASIVAVLRAAYLRAAPDARLALWTTWPKLGEYLDAVRAIGDLWAWEYVTGGAWTKRGGPGVGFHWLGNSEPVLIYKRGGPYIERSRPVSNAYASFREPHSVKPAEWMTQWIERWTEPGDLVLDLYAGMAPVARACARTGRRYVGAELDPDRYRAAVDRLALDRWALKP